MNKEILQILRSELRPALGCIGPIGVCYNVAQAYDAIGGEIKKITARVQWDRAKIDDVGLPGTEYPGLEMAIALAAVCGDPNAGLEVLHSVTPEGELKARKVAELVEIEMLWDISRADAYNEIIIETDKGIGRAICRGKGDGLVLKERNGEVLFEAEPEPTPQSGKAPIRKYKFEDLYNFAKECPIEELQICKDAVTYNKALAQATLDDNLGAGVGYYLYHNADPGDLITRAKGWAAAGCEARMSGVRLPAMSCANKGNVGIASTIPLYSLAKDLGKSEEELTRAIAFSCLIATSVVSRIGRSPSVCSCQVSACMGIAAGTVMLKGGTYEQAEIAMQNAIPSVFGVVCDGARLACATRISTGTGVGIESANLAMGGARLAFNQGVLGLSAEESLDLLGDFAVNDMENSDRELCRKIHAKRKVFPLKTFAERQKI